ncbi:hypothetical protein KCU95_g16757, partial [Aureobasidium melanogenum]
MCLVQTPYYRLCGHYGRPLIALNGRCARAERLPGACWEPQDIGVSSREAMCGNCERWLRVTDTEQSETTRIGPVDCHKFNQLVKLHRQTCDRRASEASNFSSITSAAYLPIANDLNLRRPSTVSEISVTSTTASVLSTGGRPPILTINSPSRVFRTPTWTNIEEWTKQTIHDDSPQKQETPASSDQHDSS